MACPTCKKVKVQAPMESGLPSIVLGGALRVTGSDGRRYPIQTSLVAPMHEPSGGWGVDFAIKGQFHHIGGKGPREVFAEVKRLFDLNGIKHTSLDLWFNLNLQWLFVTVEKYQKVRHQDLLKIAVHNPAYHD